MGTAPVRKRLRIAGMDYRYPGPYFVTACTAGGTCFFGEVRDGVMHLSRAGRLVLAEWYRLPRWNPWITLDAVVVMPNHFHGIVEIGVEGDLPAARRPTLGEVMGRFKFASAAAINRWRGTRGAGVWQRGYYESIIRGERGLDAIRDYIASNPGRWDRDPENPLSRRTGGQSPPLQGTSGSV